MNSQCFTKETVNFNKSDTLFEHVIDACYVLTMENSKRRSQYMYQLNKYKPFSEVRIVHNKGYKMCKKEKWIDTPCKDIADFYAFVFNECLNKGENKVLIFEDDFFFTESIETIREYVLHIQMLLDDNTFITYNLGPLPYFLIPTTINMNHYIYKGGASHAVIYSKEAMERYTNEYKTMNCSSDTYWNKYLYNYCFYKPFCFQLCPKTDNSAYWSDYIDINYLLRICFCADETHEYLFPFAYNSAKILSLLILVFIIKSLKMR